MIRRFAAVAGLRRRRVGIVPVLTPGLASLWIGLVTPVNPRVARPLVDSLVHEVVCNERDLDTLIGPPPGGAIGYDEAVAKALRGTVKDTAWRNLALTGALTAAAAVAGGLATDPESRWFRGLAKPAWQPPAAAFPIVWSLLYADIAGTTAVAASELDRRGATRERQQLLAALLANLALNAGWSWLFFRAHRPAAAAWAAGLLTISSADLARRTGGAVPTAGKVLVPYPLWCAFATVLTAAIARRNP
jgi:tryptophan-rich sensory protein